MTLKLSALGWGISNCGRSATYSAVAPTGSMSGREGSTSPGPVRVLALGWRSGSRLERCHAGCSCSTHVLQWLLVRVPGKLLSRRDRLAVVRIEPCALREDAHPDLGDQKSLSSVKQTGTHALLCDSSPQVNQRNKMSEQTLHGQSI